MAQVKRDVLPPTSFDTKMLLYLAACALIGSISSVASLLSNDSLVIKWRILAAYTMVGFITSLMVVTLLIEWYGESWFLLGCAVGASYKATDVLMAISLAVTALLKSIFKRLGGGE